MNRSLKHVSQKLFFPLSITQIFTLSLLFTKTVRRILMEYNQDYDIAPKYGTMLQEYGFQVIEQKKRTVHYGKAHH